MEAAVVVAKPKISYAQFVASQPAPKFTERSFAWMIEKYVEETGRPGGRTYGHSRGYTLKRLQRSPIGLVQYEDFKPLNFIDHCKLRIDRDKVKPQTVNQDITYTSSVLKYAVDIWDWPDTGLRAYQKARRQLIREQLISKGTARDRLPTQDELERLRARFEEENKRKKNKIDMVLVMDAELVTGRRISEICRIERQHVNVEKKTCWLYNLKNAKGKGYHAEFALIEGAWELFERRLREIPDVPEARLFPFRPQSCISRYCTAKTALGIKGLRMHDNRAQCFVQLLKKGYSAIRVRKGVSLHKSKATFEGTYVRITAEDLHDGPDAGRV